MAIIIQTTTTISVKTKKLSLENEKLKQLLSAKESEIEALKKVIALLENAKQSEKIDRLQTSHNALTFSQHHTTIYRPFHKGRIF